MQFEELDDIPMLDQVLDLQRALSAARDIEELVYTFADRFHRLYGIGAVLGLDVNGLEPGRFRLMDFVDAARGLSPDTILDQAKWDLPRDRLPVDSGGLTSELVQVPGPSLCEDIDTAQDPVLSRFLQRRCDIISIPVFHGGALDEWFLVFREPGLPIKPVLIRLLVSMFNMFSRLVIQFKLHQQVDQLNGKLDASLQEVASVQRSILPDRPPTYPSLDIAVQYEPCESAGGDYYDFRTFEDGSMGVVIADVSGHGPGAAVVMAMLRTAISIDRVLHARPDNIADTVNRFMWDGLPGGTFVTAYFLKLHPDTGRIDYTSAGHWPALLRKPDGTVTRLDQGSGPPIGMIEEVVAPGSTGQLQPGDTVLLYTDGITEAFNPDNRAFGIDALINALQTRPMGTAQQTIDAVSRAVDEHTQGRTASDDRCMVAVRYHG